MFALLAFWLPRHLWRQNWAAAVEQAKQFYDLEDRVVATNRNHFFGGKNNYHTITYVGVDATYQLRKQPACWTKMLEITDSIHRPRGFDDNFMYPDLSYPGKGESDRAILFIGELQTASGQSRFAVIELDDVWQIPGRLSLPLTVRIMLLNHETCERVTFPSLNGVQLDSDAQENEKVELKSYKRTAEQPAPRFHVRWGKAVHVFEIRLEDDTEVFQWDPKPTKITIVKMEDER